MRLPNSRFFILSFLILEDSNLIVYAFWNNKFDFNSNVFFTKIPKKVHLVFQKLVFSNNKTQ